jgi:hypothetical protein
MTLHPLPALGKSKSDATQSDSDLNLKSDYRRAIRRVPLDKEEGVVKAHS